MNGKNFLDWERNLRIVLRSEHKGYVLDEPLPTEPPTDGNEVLMVQKEKFRKKFKGKNNGKGKMLPKQKIKKSEHTTCFHCHKDVHWKRNCPLYLEEVKKKKAVSASASGIEINLSTLSNWVLDTGCGTHICRCAGTTK